MLWFCTRYALGSTCRGGGRVTAAFVGIFSAIAEIPFLAPRHGLALYGAFGKGYGALGKLLTGSTQAGMGAGGLGSPSAKVTWGQDGGVWNTWPSLGNFHQFCGGHTIQGCIHPRTSLHCIHSLYGTEPCGPRTFSDGRWFGALACRLVASWGSGMVFWSRFHLFTLGLSQKLGFHQSQGQKWIQYPQNRV